MKARPTEPELVLEFFSNRAGGFFIDVGANDPKAMSQTWLLECKGWRGILIEPLPHLAEKLRAARPGARVVQAACGAREHPATVEFHEAECSMHSGLSQHAIDARERYVSTHTVPMLALDEILEEAGNPAIDFVSIDVEGAELDVLRGFDLSRHAPALLLIEDHLFNLKVHRHLVRSGYRLVKRTGLNDWYLPQKQRFHMATAMERLKLWRKVWVGTPWRGLKHRLQLKFRQWS
jgi:FkbM family methyltransferase